MPSPDSSKPVDLSGLEGAIELANAERAGSLHALQLAAYELRRLRGCIEYLGVEIALGNTVAVLDTIDKAVAAAEGRS